MSLMDRFKKGVEKAKEEASDLAQTAKLKLDISKLNARKADLLGQIGGKVYDLHRQGRTVPEVEAQCQEISGIENQVKQMEAEIERVRRED